MTHEEVNGLADTRPVAIRCGDKRGFRHEEKDDRPGLCPGTSVISRDGTGTRRRCRAGRGFGSRRAGAGRCVGRRFCGLYRWTIDCECLGGSAIQPPPIRPQARCGGAGREQTRKRACPSKPCRYCNGCIGPACATAATSSSEGNSDAAGAAAGMSAIVELIVALVPQMFLLSRPPSATVDCGRGGHGPAGFNRRV